jgi:hypothetical protein
MLLWLIREGSKFLQPQRQLDYRNLVFILFPLLSPKEILVKL